MVEAVAEGLFEKAGWEKSEVKHKWSANWLEVEVVGVE